MVIIVLIVIMVIAAIMVIVVIMTTSGIPKCLYFLPLFFCPFHGMIWCGWAINLMGCDQLMTYEPRQTKRCKIKGHLIQLEKPRLINKCLPSFRRSIWYTNPHYPPHWTGHTMPVFVSKFLGFSAVCRDMSPCEEVRGSILGPQRMGTT